MKPSSVIHTSSELTVGDCAPSVRSRPWTIHGWRPISVMTQPAELMRNGSGHAHAAIRRKRGEAARRPRHSRKPANPASATSSPNRVDHHAERPVDDRDARRVAAGPVAGRLGPRRLVGADRPCRSSCAWPAARAGAGSSARGSCSRACR